MPQLFREPYIHAGYRPTGHEWRYYFFSLFQKHNEVVNVWTHLLAALAVLLRFWAFVEAEGLRGPDTAYALPLLVCVLSSIRTLTFLASWPTCCSPSRADALHLLLGVGYVA